MISTILTILSISLIMGMLYSASRGKAKEDEHGNLILQMPKFYWYLGALGIVIGTVLLVIAYFYVDTIDDKEIVIYMSIGITIPSCFLFAKGYISKIIVTESGISETGLFGQKTLIDWNEIASVSFGVVSQELNIQSKEKKIKAHIHLLGFGELVIKLEEKTGITSNEMGLNI